MKDSEDTSAQGGVQPARAFRVVLLCVVLALAAGAIAGSRSVLAVTLFISLPLLLQESRRRSARHIVIYGVCIGLLTVGMKFAFPWLR